MQLLLLAVAPALFVIIYIYIKDKHEKEPRHLLIYNFLFGAIVSIIVTSILYFLFAAFFPPFIEKSVFDQFIKAFLMVGLIEEFSKYIIVRYYAQSKEAFNEPFDGIVYAVMVSMGFAVTENIFYVFEGGIETAIARALTAVPAHATFGVLMGYFMGKAKFSKNKTLLNLIGLSLAIVFHGAYDFFLFIPFVPGIWTGAFVSLIVALLLSRKAIKIHQNNSHFKA